MAQSAIYRNALAAQTMLHEYRLESVLGAGSFGVTYLGRDTHLDKPVAIKEYLPTDLAMRTADGSVVPLTTEAEHGYQWGLERYILEARTLARFSHPHIVRVNRYFEANGTGYMVMDYEGGEPLSAWLKRAPRPEEAALKRMLEPLLEGLRAVHGAGFLHRDIKPDNIFVRADGSPVLIDFGAARQSIGDATKTLTAVLTPGYAPLEQYFSEGHQGPWTDIYALGGVLYRAVTDENPPDAVTRLKGDRVGETLALARGRYSATFLKSVEWALAPEEKKRPQSVDEWQRALRGAQPVPAAPAAPAAAADAATVRVAPPPKPAGALPQRSAPVARRPLPAAAPEASKRGSPWLRAFALLLIAAAAIGFWNKHRAGRERAALQAAPRVAAPRPPITLVAPQPLEAAPSPPSDNAAVSPPQDASQSDRAQSVQARPSPSPEEKRLQRLRREARAQFRSADTNGDGYLSRRETRARFPYMARIFDRVDTNGDGRISFDEFLAFRRLQVERKLER
ncbi:MAG TPA: protein kinase [Burkholderiales bacterium]|nr:protein kinase [Burkholderiales bacterium]